MKTRGSAKLSVAKDRQHIAGLPKRTAFKTTISREVQRRDASILNKCGPMMPTPTLDPSATTRQRLWARIHLQTRAWLQHY